MKKLIMPFLVVGFLSGATSVRSAETPPAASSVTPPPAVAALAPLAAGKTAPAFSLPNIENKNQSLADFRGRPVAAFFFCGCRLCHKCARAWNDVQRSGTLGPPATNAPAGPKSEEPVTIVVFHGNVEETRLFAEETQLDSKRTVLLADLAENVTESYQADPCPRVFVIDREGVVRYTNDEQGADSYKIPAPLIVSRTVEALRSVPAAKAATKPAGKAATPVKKSISSRSGNQTSKKTSQHK